MIAWMLYSALVALVVAAAARAAEWLARLARFPVRWIWAGALMLAMLLSATAPLRDGGPVALPTAASLAIEPGNIGDVQADLSWGHALGVGLEALRRSIDAPLRAAAARVHRAVSPAADAYAASAWSVVSVGLLLVLVGVGRRFRSAWREWPLVSVHGVDVRVAPHIGPVVVGLARPEIVVPRWLLARPADDQRLVVTHEAEHVRARDPLLIGAALGAAVAAPWSPAVWYMLSRLRLAVELDCDARVLSRGAAPRSYGSLLIDVAQRASALRLSALALADDSSHLRQRILAMKPDVPRFAHLRAVLAAAFALTGVLVACVATLPERPEAERTAPARAPDASRSARTSVRPAREPVQADTAAAELPLPSMNHAGFPGLVLIDGVRATETEMRSLDRNRIESVDVLKGPLAARLHPDPAAASGVIVITTKH